MLFQKVIYGNIVNKVINGNIVNMMLKITEHLIYNNIQSLTTASESRRFGSVVRALDFYPDRPGSIPPIGGIFFFFFSVMLHSFVTTFMS